MFKNTLFKLTRRLFPRGRAFKIPASSVIEAATKALVCSEDRLVQDALSVLNSILPDNNNFTIEDAEDWERRLGLTSDSTVPLEDRKKAIERKYAHPGDIKPRQHHFYLERELQAAGFAVTVLENRVEISPGEYDLRYIPNIVLDGSEMGDGVEMGNSIEMGGTATSEYELLVNYVNSERDRNHFNGVAGVTEYKYMLRASFFICDGTYNTPVNIPLNRQDEFRNLILNIKPVQTIGLLNVNWI